MHGGVARPKRFHPPSYRRRRPSGLQGIITDRKRHLLSYRNTRTKAEKHLSHKLFGKYASSRKVNLYSVPMANHVSVKVSSKRSLKAPKKSKVHNESQPKKHNESHLLESVLKESRAAAQSSARASRAARRSETNKSMSNINHAKAAKAAARAEAIRSRQRLSMASLHDALPTLPNESAHHAAAAKASKAAKAAARAEAIRSGKRMSMASLRHALSNLPNGSANHAHAHAHATSHDPRRLLNSQNSQESQ